MDRVIQIPSNEVIAYRYQPRVIALGGGTYRGAVYDAQEERFIWQSKELRTEGRVYSIGIYQLAEEWAESDSEKWLDRTYPGWKSPQKYWE